MSELMNEQNEPDSWSPIAGLKRAIICGFFCGIPVGLLYFGLTWLLRTAIVVSSDYALTLGPRRSAPFTLLAMLAGVCGWIILRIAERAAGYRDKRLLLAVAASVFSSWFVASSCAHLWIVPWSEGHALSLHLLIAVMLIVPVLILLKDALTEG